MNRSEEIDDPVRFDFEDSRETHCEVEGSNNVEIVRFSWYKKSLCIIYFFEEYHYYTSCKKL